MSEPTYQTGDKVIVTDGPHKGKVGVVSVVTNVNGGYVNLIDGITKSKTLRAYKDQQLKPAPKKPPSTDPLVLKASEIFLEGYRARKAAEAAV